MKQKETENPYDEKTTIIRRDAALARALSTPHKPHMSKKKSKELLSESPKKKSDGSPAKKNRRP